MKVRQILTTAALAVAAISFSASASAECNKTSDLFVKVSAELIQKAVDQTITELNQGTMKEILTASLHVEPESVETTLVTKVEIKDIKEKG